MHSHNPLVALWRFLLRTLGLLHDADNGASLGDNESASKEEAQADWENYPYALRDDFLSRAELNFLRVLTTILHEELLLCPKVSLGDLFFATCSDRSERVAYTNKIDRKHVDFLLCDRQTLTPQAGIELDDGSHTRRDRQARDAFVEGVFDAAGLRLIRIAVKQSYAPAELRQALGDLAAEPPSPMAAAPLEEEYPVAQDLFTPSAALLSASPLPENQQVRVAAFVAPAPPSDLPGTSLFGATTPAVNIPATPRCPKCGSEMVLRTAKNGANRGEQFWGCMHYPKCRGIIQCAAEAP